MANIKAGRLVTVQLLFTEPNGSQVADEVGETLRRWQTDGSLLDWSYVPVPGGQDSRRFLGPDNPDTVVGIPDDYEEDELYRLVRN